MARLIVALDADVLVPIVACDFLLTAFELGLYEPVVSTRVLDEVERGLIIDHPNLSADAVRYRVTAMRDALEDHLIDSIAAEVPNTINSKDQHVVGAALLGEAMVLASNDRRLRAEVAGSLPALSVLSLNEFGLSLWQRSPEEISSVVDALVAKRSKPRATRDTILDAMRRHVPLLVDQLLQTPY